MRIRHTALIAAALLAACDSSTGPTRYSAQGTWAGQETSGTTLISLVLTQKGDAVTGTGTVRGEREIAVTAEGSAISADFSVVLTSPGYQPVQMTGGFTSRNEIAAYMVGSGFYGDEIVLRKQ
ncbi:MAG TPA: hypothetical protein VFJ82_24920 [Longimicrobium sp.]|nr:hypothetical protein [Longimicrobium sp.]